MKDKLASYNHLIETFVIVTETFLCGLLFLLFSKLSNEMQWDSLQVGGITVLQIMLTLMLCYALCAIHSGVVLHLRKVHSLQIWIRVLENMFLFVLLGGLVLSVGNYADIASLFMLEYLFLLFMCLVSFRFTLRLLIRLLLYRTFLLTFTKIAFTQRSASSGQIDTSSFGSSFGRTFVTSS